MIHVNCSKFNWSALVNSSESQVRYAATSYAMKAWRWEPNFCVANLYRDPDARRQKFNETDVLEDKKHMFCGLDTRMKMVSGATSFWDDIFLVSEMRIQ